MSDPYETAAARAAEPAKYSAGGESMEQFPLRDQIELAEKQSAQDQVKKPRMGLRFLGTKNPGAY